MKMKLRVVCPHCGKEFVIGPKMMGNAVVDMKIEKGVEK